MAREPPEPLFPYTPGQLPYTPGQPPEPLVPSYVVLEPYLARANVARQACPVDLTNDKGRGHPSVLLWLGCLFVVQEGWVAEGLRNDAVKPLLRRKGFVTLLEAARDTTFHYERSLVPRTLEQVHTTAGFLSWADQLHAAFVEALRRYAQVSRIPVGLRRLKGQRRRNGDCGD